MSEPRIRVLLAEDSLLGQRAALAILELLAFSVDVVGDGACAVHAANRSTFDLILMDCQMPILDGYAATRKIRASSAARVPIIGMSTDTTGPVRTRCLAAGMDDCLGKPLTTAGVSDAFTRWIGDAADPIAAEPQIADSVAEPLDRRVITGLERLGASSGEDVLGQIAVMFVDEAVTRTAALHAALDTKDDDAMAFVSHTLAGSAAGVGAKELRERCIRLEAGGTAQQLAAVEAELSRVCGALSGLVKAA
jgi:two-component system sensor histidine kinase/response regulator